MNKFVAKVKEIAGKTGKVCKDTFLSIKNSVVGLFNKPAKAEQGRVKYDSQMKNNQSRRDYGAARSRTAQASAQTDGIVDKYATTLSKVLKFNVTKSVAVASTICLIVTLSSIGTSIALFSSTPGQSAAVLSENTVSEINEKVYTVTDVDPDGDGIILLDDTGRSLMPEGSQLVNTYVNEEDETSESQETSDPQEASDSQEPEEEKELWLEPGTSDEQVLELQERLMELDYMDDDKPTEYYGTQTAYAVQLFQRKHDLAIDGIVGQVTYDIMFSDEAMMYTVSEGINGTDVKEIQKRLIELGYLNSDATGYFGTATTEAVKEFQDRNGLSPDGNVGEMTREELYSPDAREARNSSSSSSSSGSSSSSSGSSSSSSGSSSSEPAPDPDKSLVENVLSIAKAQLGDPYVRAGKGPDKFDCSGFVYWVLNQAGYDIGYMTSSGWASSGYTTIKSKSDLQAGDILCFDGHVGIYMGNETMIDASSSEGGIRIDTNIWSSDYWNSHYKYAKRVLT